MPLDPRVRALIDQGMPALMALRKVGLLPPIPIEDLFDFLEPKPPTPSSPSVEPPATAPSTVLH